MNDPDKTWTEYGYRMSDGTEIWVEDHGRDGAWAPANEPGGLPYVIDIWGHLDDDAIAAIRQQLKGAATVISRRIETYYGPTEEHP